MQNTRVGINLLTCSLAHCPLHLESMKHAIRSLLGSDIGLFDWRLQIVDNGSTCPETQAFLEQLQLTNERVDVEWAGENLGIARGRLAALYAAGGRGSEAMAMRESLARQWRDADPQFRARSE